MKTLQDILYLLYNSIAWQLQKSDLKYDFQILNNYGPVLLL